MDNETIDIRDKRPDPDESCTCIWTSNESGYGYVFISMNDCPAKPHSRMKVPT